MRAEIPNEVKTKRSITMFRRRKKPTLTVVARWTKEEDAIVKAEVAKLRALQRKMKAALEAA